MICSIGTGHRNVVTACLALLVMGAFATPARSLSTVLPTFDVAGDSTDSGRLFLSEADLVTPPHERSLHGAPSPDGRHLAYVVEEEARRTLWIKAIDVGRPPVRVSQEKGNDDFPDWSPDGKELYFHSDRTGEYKIWMYDLESQRSLPITFGPSEDFHPRVSPTGREIAFDSNRAGSYDIWVQRIGTGAARAVTTGEHQDFSPAWSPDGSRLAFTSSRKDGFQIWVTEATGEGRPRQLTRGDTANAHPDWSPDGKWIAYDSDAGGTTRVWLVAAGQGASGRIPLEVAGWRQKNPRWGPGGLVLFHDVEGNGLAGVRRARPVLPAAGLPHNEPSNPRETAAARVETQDTGEGVRAGREAPRISGGLGAAAAHTVQSQRVGGLRIIRFFPISRSKGVETSAPIGFVCDENLDTRDLASRVRMRTGDHEVPLEVSYNPTLRRVDVMPGEPLTPGSVYRIAVSRRLASERGSRLGEPFFWSFATREAPARTTVLKVGEIDHSFRIVDRVPSGRGGAAPRTLQVQVGFTHTLDRKSIDARSLQLHDSGGRQILGELQFPPGDDRLTLRPFSPLTPGETYRVLVSPAIRASTGEPITGKLDWTFRVAYEGPLFVTGVSPRADLKARPRIRVRFNRPLSSETLTAGKVLLQGPDYAYSGSVSLTANGDEIVFEPYQRLPNGKEYVLFLPVGLTDIDGNGLRQEGPIKLSTNYDATSANLGGDELDRFGRGGKSAEARRLLSRYLHEAAAESENLPREQVTAMKVLAAAGHLGPEFLDDLDRHDGQLTRYRAALYLEKAFARRPFMKPEEVILLDTLARQLATELSALGVSIPQGGRAVRMAGSARSKATLQRGARRQALLQGQLEIIDL